MRFIEIREGISIDINEIEAIEDKDKLNSKIYTHHNTYTSTFPRTALIQLIEKHKGGQSSPGQSSKDDLMKAFLKNFGTFAG